MVGRILYLCFGTLMIAFGVLDATFTTNRDVDTTWVLGGIELMIGAVAVAVAERRKPAAPRRPVVPPQRPPSHPYPGQDDWYPSA
ncbi:MAG: hypothetical protein HOY71_09460 [Nonomuraea sp.]|nr:hypothetical protein [Nonomuraea sp.]